MSYFNEDQQARIRWLVRHGKERRTHWKSKLEALIREREAIEAKLAKLKARRRQLLNEGEIKEARLALRDAAYPILAQDIWATIRVVAVDDNWITTRIDGRDDVQQHARTTGRMKNKRTDWNKIDAAKAIKIWEEHIAAQKDQSPASEARERKND